MAPLMEYKHSNAEMLQKDIMKVLHEIVHFYIIYATQWNDLYNGLEVNVDTGGGHLVEVDKLNTIRRKIFPDAN